MADVEILSSLIGVNAPGIPPGAGEDSPEGVADVDEGTPRTSEISDADFAEILFEFRRRARWCL